MFHNQEQLYHLDEEVKSATAKTPARFFEVLWGIYVF